MLTYRRAAIREDRIRPHVGVADRLRRGRNCRGLGGDLGEGHRGIAATRLRTRLEPRRSTTGRGHGRRRVDLGGRDRQWLPPRRTDGHHKSLRTVRAWVAPFAIMPRMMRDLEPSRLDSGLGRRGFGLLGGRLDGPLVWLAFLRAFLGLGRVLLLAGSLRRGGRLRCNLGALFRNGGGFRGHRGLRFHCACQYGGRSAHDD